MKVNLLLITPIFFLFTQISYSQHENYGIQMRQPYKSEVRNCQQCKVSFQEKAKEISFGIKKENDDLYFTVNDEEWFNTLFKNVRDGLAIDVVEKGRYDCSVLVDGEKNIRGRLLKPVFSSNLKKGIMPIDNNLFRVWVGKIPSDLLGKELEYNILFLGNNTLCRYQTLFNIQAYTWDILDMGMYLDSISFDNRKIGKTVSGFNVNYKTLLFEIPFKKNKSTYQPSDIQPLYDSLNLNNYNIKKITVRAYSSVEGEEKYNLALQKQRASSIISALQTFQRPSMSTEVLFNENWVGFFEDIQNTEFEYLRNLDKPEIKKLLESELAGKMEAILSNHRKAIVSLELVYKDFYESMNDEDLVLNFNKSIENNDLVRAVQLQNSLFNRLKYFEISPDILDKLEIPEQLMYVRFLNNRSAYKFQLDERRILITKAELEELLELDKTNKRINYNLVVLKFKMWRFRLINVDYTEFLKEINALKKFGIEQNLIDRMVINYHIIKAERDLQDRKYEDKDESVEFIYDSYDTLSLSDFDYFSLAQFLTYYANLDWAAELLNKKVRSVGVDEDLLFYYLNLTMIDRRLTATEDYKTIILNASTMNKLRYCNLFNSIDKDGVTFQLLEDINLRKGYCEICN